MLNRNRKDKRSVNNMDKVAKRRKAQQEKRQRNTNITGNVSIYSTDENNIYNKSRLNKRSKLDKNVKKNKRDKKMKLDLFSSSNLKNTRRKGLKKRSLKGYYIVLALAILFLLIAIVSGNKKDDVSKYFFLNNEKTNTINPIKITLAKNSTAKVALFSLDDIREYFDKDIRYNVEEKEIITIGDTHVARIILNDYSVNLNGTDTFINVSVFEEDGKIYLPLNDLSSVYGIEVFIPENNRVIVDNVHKAKKIVKTMDKTKLKKSKSIFSKTLIKLSDFQDSVLVEEGKSKLKIRTLEGLFGYISAKKVKTIVEIRTDYIEDELPKYNIIRNYSTPEDNFDDVKLEGEYNAAIVDIFKTSISKNKLVLSEKYKSTGSSYKIYREKLNTNNINTIGSLNLEKYDLSNYLNTFLKRQEFIASLLKISNKHNIHAVELNVSDSLDLKLYENFVEELKPRLKERGLKLTIQKDKIKSDKIKENIDYES